MAIILDINRDEKLKIIDVWGVNEVGQADI